jgi:uncharacterized peroxidase-related enzyme
MTEFTIHTIESAPEASRDVLRGLEGALGFVPNLAATMATSPALAGGFGALRGALGQTELTGAERELVALAAANETGCEYCLAAHSAFARMQGAEAEAVDAARSGHAPADARLGALYRFARAVTARNGQVDMDELRAAGYSPRAALDVVAQIGFTTLASLTWGLAGTPVDAGFTP